VADLSGQQFYQACTDLKDALDNKRMVHKGQDNWIQQMNNCAAKVNDSAWRIIKRKSAGDISGAIATGHGCFDTFKTSASTANLCRVVYN